MTLTNKRKRISGVLLVFAAIACIMMGVWSVHKTAAADGEFECSETKCLLSNDKTGMLIATAIKNYDYVYEIGYEFTKGSASENDFTATDRYFREISKGGKSVTAGDIFGLNYADAALAVWEITYDPHIEYEFKFYAKVGKLGSDGQTVVKQDPEQIVYSETKNVVTYTEVKHYIRNINGSYTLKETETNVPCMGTPSAKTYAGYNYGSNSVDGTVCNMYYELDGITFNVPNFTATGFDGAGSYAAKGTVVDGENVYNNVYEGNVTSGTSSSFLNIAYGNNTGKWLILSIKQTYSLVNSALQFIDGNGGWHTDNNYPTWFDINGATITYDSSYTGWKIMAVHLDSTSFPANGALNVNFFLWNLGAVQIGEYAFVTQEQLNLLGYYSGSETSDIQVNGWVAPESYSDDMLEKIAAAGLTSVSFAAAGTQYIDPSDLSASKDIINRYAKYGINIYTVGGVANFASMGDFANYGNVLGLMLDEPNKSQIDEIAAVIDTFNTANVGNKVLIVNLLPSYASAVTSDFSAYSAYLKYLYDNVLGKLKCELWISVDRYPIVRDAKGNPTLDSGWLGDVEAVATFAKANGLKKNFFIQTMPYGSGGFNDSHDRAPTKEDITLQYYVLLAYGYDSISLFCLGTPAPDGTTFLDGQNAMINRNNETTDIYTAVKEVNEELNKFDFILNRFSWDAAVLNTSSLLTSVQAKKIGLKDISSTKNALFSHLVDETRGREAYCVVNYNDTSLNYTNTITLTFSGETILTVIQNGGFRTVTSASGEFTFTLGVGESIIVIK